VVALTIFGSFHRTLDCT